MWLLKGLPFVVMLAALVLTPLTLRGFDQLLDASGKNRSYLPSFENRRARKQFRTEPIERLRIVNPGWVFIGDSMLGTRIHPELLGEIAGQGDRRVEFLLHAASGPTYWYLSYQERAHPERRASADDVLLLPRHEHDRHAVPASEQPR